MDPGFWGLGQGYMWRFLLSWCRRYTSWEWPGILVYRGEYTNWGIWNEKIFAGVMGVMEVLYAPSLIYLDFFPVLHLIEQTPDVGCQTEGRIWGGERRCLHIGFNASCQGISSSREPKGPGGEEQSWRWVTDLCSAEIREMFGVGRKINLVQENTGIWAWTWMNEWIQKQGHQGECSEVNVYHCGRSHWLGKQMDQLRHTRSAP